jgi:flagellar motor switch protein FliN/FliY
MNAIPPKGVGSGTGAKEVAHDGVGLGDPDPETVALDRPDTAADASAPSDADLAPPEPEAKTRARRGLSIAVPAHLSAIEVSMSVEVGSLRMPLRDLLTMEPGQIFALDRMTSEPVDVLVNGRKFARGEVVAIGQRYGVRLTQLVDDEN